jgi:hypothetical protein
MTSAPEWIWDPLSFLCVCAGLAVAILSDPVYLRLKHPHNNPVFSTCAISICAAAILGSAWWFFVVQRSSKTYPIEIESGVDYVFHPVTKEKWYAFVVVLSNTSKRLINDVTVEIVDFYDEETKKLPFGFEGNIRQTLVSGQSMHPNLEIIAYVVFLKNVKRRHQSPDIYIGKELKWDPEIDKSKQLWNPAILKINVTSNDHPEEVLSKTIRVEHVEGKGPKAEIIGD